MTAITGNFGLTKPDKEDFYDIEVQNENMEVIDQKLKELETGVDQIREGVESHRSDYVRQPGAGTTTGSTNKYSLTLSPIPAAYVDGMGIVLKINTDSTAASTINVNGLGAKPLKKANGNDVTNMKSGGIYTYRYNSTAGNFILQGEGGEYGNVMAANVDSGILFGTELGLQTGSSTKKKWASGTGAVPFIYTYDAVHGWSVIKINVPLTFKANYIMAYCPVAGANSSYFGRMTIYDLVANVACSPNYNYTSVKTINVDGSISVGSFGYTQGYINDTGFEIVLSGVNDFDSRYPPTISGITFNWVAVG